MVREPIAEVDREWSKIEYKRRPTMPKQKDRPPSPIVMEPKEDILNELLKRSNEIINDAIIRGKSKGTGHATRITTDKIVMDPRVRWKCRIPICFGYGMTLNCPPHSPTTEEMTEIVNSYKEAILITFNPPPKNAVFPDYPIASPDDINLLNQMVSRIEADATYLGYYLAMGFKGGPCCGCGFLSPEYLKDSFKRNKLPPCPSLNGEMCPQYLKARPALEACGVDVFATAVKCGERTPYVINPEHSKKAVPFAVWHGIVLVV